MPSLKNNSLQRQTAVTAYFSSKQLLLFVFAGQTITDSGAIRPGSDNRPYVTGTKTCTGHGYGPG